MKFLWVDMEMTGLDVSKEVIIEVAAVVTDEKLSELEKYHAVVRQSQDYLDRMDDWNKKHHKASGLVDLVSTGKSVSTVEIELLELCDKYFGKDRIVLAGNSIGQDRLFITKYMPEFEKRLHYRMLDVTSFKLVFNYMYSISYAKKESRHRALDDIAESINEFKKYLSYIKA